VKKAQWITIGVAGLLLVALLFARKVPEKKIAETTEHGPDDGHNHGGPQNLLPVDSILALAKKQLSAEQVVRINTLENSITRGDVKDQQLHVYHQLARFWSDSAGIFEPYAWYEAEAARLENSEKTLTFAARQFLDNLQNDEVLERRQWKALQAKDLFERSLKINPDNDSAKVGLGACYLFGNISDAPMEGIGKIKSVLDKDSTNVYAQLMLAKGSLLSGQYDKAISRLQTINRLQTDNLEAMMLLADVYERTNDKISAAAWYQKSLPFIKQPEMKKAVENRIAEIKK
jgi:tetratricopeptide (TPR) repeat protein